MALKLGELVAYLKADNSQFDKGLDKAERDFRDTGRELTEQARKTGAAIGDGLVTGADGRLNNARGRFVAAGAGAGAASALGFLGRFGGKFGSSLSDAVSGGFSGLPPQVQGGVAIAATMIGVTFAAAAGAAITAGILLAVGGGVLALGIKAALESPQVKAAWAGFGERAKKVFADFGKPFEGPMIRAADTFGDALERMGPTFKRMGESMAPVIDKLAPALADMAEKALPGIEKALEAGKPLWDTLAEHLPEIGNAVSLFFGKIAEGSPGANKFLKDMLNVIEGSIIIMGVLIGWLAKAYGKTRDAFSGAFKIVRSGVNWLDDVPGKLRKAFSKLGGWISAPFKAGFNAIARAWNNTVGRLSWTVPGWVPGFGGNSISAPNIPMLAKGGHIIGAGSAIVGEKGPELLDLPSGATVRPLSGGSAGVGGHAEVRLTGEFRVRGSDLVLVLRDRVAVGGGDVQRVIGTDN